MIGGMARPQILLVPTLTELEWPIKPLLEEWADVASYDAPGVGGEPPPRRAGPAAVVARGLAEVDRLGWDRYVVVGDEFGSYNAAQLAAARPESVRGVALGHASLSSRTSGPGAAIHEPVLSALNRLMSLDYGSYARALTQVTRDAYDDGMCERYIERVPQEVNIAFFAALLEEPVEVEALLEPLDVPLALVEHVDCAMWTSEGFIEARAAFPRALTRSLSLKPSANPEFSQLLREFCAALPDG